MPAPSESFVALEHQFAAGLIRFDELDEAWPHGRTALERAQIGRQRKEALCEIVTLRQRIVTGRAETVADAAVQLRRLAAMTEVEDSTSLHSLLATPDVRGLVFSALHAVEAAAIGEQR